MAKADQSAGTGDGTQDGAGGAGESITFALEGDARIDVSITENDDGTLDFSLSSGDGDDGGAIRGLFFDSVDDQLVSGLYAQGPAVEGQAFAAGGVDGVPSASGGLPSDGDLFDGGVGLSGSGNSSFTLGHVSEQLFVEDFEGMDFAARLSASPDAAPGDTIKLSGQSPLLDETEQAEDETEDDVPDNLIDFPVPTYQLDEEEADYEDDPGWDDDFEDL